jgi:hypothetical protein
VVKAEGSQSTYTKIMKIKVAKWGPPKKKKKKNNNNNKNNN